MHNSRAMRRFVSINLGNEPVPDETTLLHFRHLMEKHNLGDQLLSLVNAYLAESGLKINRGTLIGAAIRAVVTDPFISYYLVPLFKEIVLNALLMAVWQRKPKQGVTIHSDQGWQ